MKKYTFSIAAVVLALTFATATGFSRPKKHQASNFYWFDPGYTIQSKSTVDVSSTISEEKNRTGCGGISGLSCKDGYASTNVIDDGNGNWMAYGTKTTIYQSF